VDLTAFFAALDALDTRLSAASRLAQLWAERGRNEHASIASFDRFALGLLGVGAPPELIEQAHVAAIDEIGHARLCFALASAYAGRTLGPGALDLEGALEVDHTLSGLCAATAVEGCIGETLSAIEAGRCAELATDQAAKTALDTIATDEAGHAELAWATVRWTLESEPAIRNAVADAFRRGLAGEGGPPGYACNDAEVGGHGFLDPAEARAVRRDGIDRVIRPAAIAIGLLPGA